MPSSIRVGLSVSTLAVALSASAALTFSTGVKETPGNARPDLNAFVNHRIDTTASLLHEVKSDPEVADRYERHFAMNRRELLAYLSDLHPTKLRQSGTYTVYSVPDGGYVKMHRQAMKKGAPIFADRAGRPTLIVKCGNPLVLGPSKARKGNLLTTLPPEGDDTREMALLTPRDAEVENPENLLAMAPPFPEEILPPTTPMVGGGAAQPLVTSVPATVTGGGGLPWFSGLPLFVPIFGSLGHHGGGGGGIAPVPEPTSTAMMAVGLLILRRRAKR